MVCWYMLNNQVSVSKVVICSIASFHGVNILTMTDFKLPKSCHEQCRKKHVHNELPPAGERQAAQLSTPLEGTRIKGSSANFKSVKSS